MNRAKVFVYVEEILKLLGTVEEAREMCMQFRSHDELEERLLLASFSSFLNTLSEADLDRLPRLTRIRLIRLIRAYAACHVRQA